MKPSNVFRFFYTLFIKSIEFRVFIGVFRRVHFAISIVENGDLGDDASYIIQDFFCFRVSGCQNAGVQGVCNLFGG